MEFNKYFVNINKKISQSTEYTLRTDFENLLNAIKQRKTIEIIQENKKIESQTFGKPDFRISENDLELGYIETKPYKDNLSDYLKTKQLKRYLNVIPNLLFTNYRDFILFRNGEIILKSTLIIKGENNLQTENIEKTKQLIYEFFGAKFRLIARTERLSVVLAKHTQYLRDEITELWFSDEKTRFKEKLKGLYNLFSKTLIEELKAVDFIDAYSQTITYGLLLAALSSDKKINKSNFVDFIPKSLSIFEEIFSLLRLANIPVGISWIVDKIFIILNNTDYSEVQKELSFAYRKNKKLEDPYIYFYENFLKAYNNQKRLEKGVYYTPAAVVHFIVKVVQQSLVQDFKKSGLDDDDISLLDFATGTGTFLLEAFKTALENVDKGLKNGFIRNKLLKNFFGFEYLIAPYVVAHLKLSKFLQEEGYIYKGEDRTQIFLTDTLDDAYYQRNPLFPYISDEGEFATKIKFQNKMWVVLGNPPYSNFSVNKKPFITNLISDYKKGLRERKINLDDDYIKFLRFAQLKIEGIKYSYKKGKNTINGKIEANGQGIVGVITNNSYLNGVTHRNMRKSLLKTFDKIYIINLHGNSIIGEKCKNIFDITVGVSIAIFIKLPKPLKQKQVYYYSTLKNNILKREDKYNLLFNNDINSINWIKLKPKEPYFWFVKKDLTHKRKYDKGWSVNKIFKIYSSGIQTGKDKLVIDLDKNKLEKRIKEVLTEKNEEKIREKYELNDTSGWQLKRFKKSQFSKNKFTKIAYRPFDFRHIYYGKFSMKRDRRAVLQHFRDNCKNRENVGLIFPRIVKGQKSNYGFISNLIIDIAIGGRFTGSETYIAPLYIYNTNGDFDETGNGFLFKNETKKDNFTKEFRNFLKKQKLYNYTPEQILGYIYAIMYAEIYRTKYFEFFKIDFPKIPFTKDIEIFEKLSELGEELIENHLLKRSYQRKKMPVFAVEGSNEIEKFYYNKIEERLYINKNQYFERFLQNVWEFEIGGYQVFEKYLKSRKGLILSYNEINFMKKISASISKTIELQKKINNLCFDWI